MIMAVQEDTEAKGDHSFAGCGSNDADDLNKYYVWMERMDVMVR